MITITGAGGNVGRPLVKALVAAGEQVTAVSRHPAPATPPGAGPGPEPGTGPGTRPGVRHQQADLAEPESLKAALDGADALFLLVAGDDPARILDLARASGVRRVVLLSSQGAGTRPGSYRHAAAFEAAVRQSGVDGTVLRPGGFDTNAFAWAPLVRTQRTVAAPFGDVGLPAVDPADIAAAAAVVLRGRGHAGRTYELTGPAPVSPRQQAAAIGAALGAPVGFTELTRGEARAQLLQFMPEPVADATLGILGDPAPAEQRVSPDLAALLGRPPATFADWAARHAAAFR
jgi:uncharacterized protein YbjT (DUF2867 family)